MGTNKKEDSVLILPASRQAFPNQCRTIAAYPWLGFYSQMVQTAAEKLLRASPRNVRRCTAIREMAKLVSAPLFKDINFRSISELILLREYLTRSVSEGEGQERNERKRRLTCLLRKGKSTTSKYNEVRADGSLVYYWLSLAKSSYTGVFVVVTNRCFPYAEQYYRSRAIPLLYAKVC